MDLTGGPGCRHTREIRQVEGILHLCTPKAWPIRETTLQDAATSRAGAATRKQTLYPEISTPPPHPSQATSLEQGESLHVANSVANIRQNAEHSSGALDKYTLPYTSCAGRRKALLFGFNYFSSTRPASRMHQRCKKHLGISQRALWVPEERYGASYR